MKNPNEQLEEFAKIFLDKNSNDQYEDNYLKFGKVCEVLFPNGLNLECESDFNEIGIIFMLIHKLLRITANSPFLYHEGHIKKVKDNAKDLSIYGAMLASLIEKYTEGYNAK